MNPHQELVSMADLVRRFTRTDRSRALLRVFADDYYASGIGFTDKEAADSVGVARCHTAITNFINYGLIEPVSGAEKPRRCKLKSRGLALFARMKDVPA